MKTCWNCNGEVEDNRIEPETFLCYPCFSANERDRRIEDAKPEAEALVELLVKAGGEPHLQTALAIAMSHEHRTNQQQAARALIRLLEMWAAADKPGYYDARNEAIVKMAKRMLEAAPNRHLPYL